MSTRTLMADRGDAGRRLDLVLRRRLVDAPAVSRTRVQAWIERGLVTVNGTPAARAAARVACGDRITVALPDARPERRQRPAAEAGNLDVLFESPQFIAVNKPAGVVVHPTYKHASGTLMNRLLWRARDWPGGARPSLLGRLDKLTSGVVIAAKSPEAHAALQRAMRTARKDYLALVYGRVTPARGVIDRPLGRAPSDRRLVVVAHSGGAASVTRFERLASAAAPVVGLALVRCRLVTGRMHQIRVHLASSGWPIVGDAVYGEPRWSRIADPALAAVLRDFPRQALHAWRIALDDPFGGGRVQIEAPIPPDLAGLLAASGLSARAAAEPG